MELGVSYPNQMSIGRVVVRQTHRDKKLGSKMLVKAIDFCRKKFPKTPIKISAQTHLKVFYSQLGFTYKGEAYLEDGIPHCAMYLK
jgi:ElaA protein